MLHYISRRGTDCYKWDSPEAQDCQPMWVADMDFAAALPIRDALQRRLDHGVFGYTIVPQAYYDAVSDWFSRRHGWQGMQREQMIYTTGVVPAISAILRAMTRKGDKVITFTPAYNCFFSSIRNMDCELLPCPLIEHNAHFEIDWQVLERQLREARVFLLCNPHNPTGRVWTREELTRIATLCEQAGVFVISDEIHCEFTFSGYHYTPYATIAKIDNYAVCTSASKAFNIAGLQMANIFVPNAAQYSLIDRAINIHEVCDVNAFAAVATIAAYNESEDWLQELNTQIEANYRLVAETLSDSPSFQLTRMEGTYLAWIKLQSDESSEAFCQRLAREEHVLLNPSEMYGATHYVRINLATSPENIRTALAALLRSVSE